jgi:hypothetical protein
MRVLALASYDSFLNTARLIAPYYERTGATVELALVKARMTSQIAKDQIDQAGLTSEIRWVDLDSLFASGDIGRYDVVLSCLEGLSTRRLLDQLKALGPNRPLVVSIYPGLVLRYAYDGFSMRAASDFLWLNSERDFENYTLMAGSFGGNGDNARVFGVASVLEPIVRKPDSAANGPVVFFEQAVIPRYQGERMFLAEQLVALARRNPSRRFLIKPRTVDGQATLHQSWHPIMPLLRTAAHANGGWPANLEITSDRADALLTAASHCITVSSTVAVESVYAGVPTAIISDFGAHDDYGLQYFFGSGLLTNFGELEFPFAGIADPTWLARNASDPRRTVAALVEETVAAAARARQPLGDEHRAAEYSTPLRAYLERKYGVDRVLSRSFQKSPVSRSLGLAPLVKVLRRLLPRKK